MTWMYMIVVAGVAIGLGVWLIVVKLSPVHANLTDALASLRPQPRAVQVAPSTWTDRLGQWSLNRLPRAVMLVSDADLRLLQTSPANFFGQKTLLGLAGAALPSVLATVVALLGIHINVAIPAVATLALAVVLFFMPDLIARDKAASLRREFRRALSSYVDLVALERSCGSGARQGLEAAAKVGDSWVFHLLSERLDKTTWEGLPPWDGLAAMSQELGLPELGDVADIMRLTGSQGAGVYTILRARAQSMRSAMVTDALAKANETNERMSIPVSLLGIVFLAILIGPALMSMLAR